MAGYKIENVSGDYADLTLLQGKTISIPMVWGGASPVDVTSYSARMTIKDTYGGSTYADFTVANSRVTIGSTNGLITFSMTATDSAALSAPFQGVFEIEVTSGSGAVYRGLHGSCKVLPEVVT